jgi:hypothetical protein
VQKIKKFWQSPRNRTILGIVVIAILVVYTFLFVPKEPDSNLGIANDNVTPTVSITNPVETLNVNQSMAVQGLHVTVTQVQEATAFSDDRTHKGTYTVRVNMVMLNPGQSTIGIIYPALARLTLPDGEVIAPKLVGISPDAPPNLQQSGYIDFPVMTQVNLSSLTFHLSNEAIAFG